MLIDKTDKIITDDTDMRNMIIVTTDKSAIKNRNDESITNKINYSNVCRSRDSSGVRNASFSQGDAFTKIKFCV